MPCDHDNCKTAYCPHCGEAMNINTLDTLLVHIHAAINSTELAVGRAERETRGSNEQRAKDISRTKRTAKKWRDWRDALIELMNKNNEVPEE